MRVGVEGEDPREHMVHHREQRKGWFWLNRLRRRCESDRLPILSCVAEHVVVKCFEPTTHSSFCSNHPTLYYARLNKQPNSDRGCSRAGMALFIQTKWIPLSFLTGIVRRFYFLTHVNYPAMKPVVTITWCRRAEWRSQGQHERLSQWTPIWSCMWLMAKWSSCNMNLQ